MKKLIIFLISLFMINTMALAKTIKLYSEPKDKSSVIGTIDLAKGVMPIFTPKGSDWVKVADPTNGNVGWVKSKDLGDTHTSFSFTQKVIENGKEEPYQFFQFGSAPLNDAQQQQMLQNFQKQNQAAQKAMQDMMQDLNNMYQRNMKFMNENGFFPMVMPVVVVPVQQAPAKK